jgi:hypothetical protein
MKHVGPQKGTPGGDRGTEIVSDDCSDGAKAKRRNEPERISRDIEQAKGSEVAIVGGVPAAGASVAPLVGGDDMEARGGERNHHLSPRERQLPEAVEKQNARPPLLLKIRPQGRASASR